MIEKFRGFNLIEFLGSPDHTGAYINQDEVAAIVDNHSGEDYKSCEVILKSGTRIQVMGAAYYQLKHMFPDKPAPAGWDKIEGGETT
jgi:hypothetical protein